MRALILAAILAGTAFAAPAQQSETLADIKQDISVLFVELQRLQQELNTTGASDVAMAGGVLDRVNAIEAELRRVTAKIEELEFRIERVVEDGTNRLGDLDFRVCEIEPSCNIATLGQTPRLGGNAVPDQAPAQPVSPGGGTDAGAGNGQLAVSEEADFDAARAALEAGDYSGAAQLFATFRESYPRSPLEPAALVAEGRALEALGDTREAARRFLAAYSDYPDAQAAPEALFRLGTSLATLGSAPEACVTLGEVSNRYPGSDFAPQAQSRAAEIGCQ